VNIVSDRPWRPHFWTTVLSSPWDSPYVSPCRRLQSCLVLSPHDAGNCLSCPSLLTASAWRTVMLWTPSSLSSLRLLHPRETVTVDDAEQDTSKVCLIFSAMYGGLCRWRWTWVGFDLLVRDRDRRYRGLFARGLSRLSLNAFVQWSSTSDLSIAMGSRRMDGKVSKARKDNEADRWSRAKDSDDDIGFKETGDRTKVLGSA
jgi:hypothetical protein